MAAPRNYYQPKQAPARRRRSAGNFIAIAVLSLGGLVIVAVGGIVLIAVVAGVVGGTHVTSSTTVGSPLHGSQSASPQAEAPASSAPTLPTSATPMPVPSPSPVVTHKTVETSVAEPFPSTTVDDPDADAGTSTITTAGHDGTVVTTWDVTETNGVETSRVALKTQETVAPITQVTAIGTKPPEAAPDPSSQCDPNYDPCVPIASDVDCAGGSGNGPAYVQGPVHVIGRDIYKLDADGDGWGCTG